MSDHSIVMVKVASGPIKITIRERKCIRKTNWESYREELEGVEVEPLEGKETEEINNELRKLTEVLKQAIDKHVPKISSRTLPHPFIDGGGSEDQNHPGIKCKLY